MELFRHVDGASVFASEKMKKNNLFETERMFCDVYCFESGQAQKAHAHTGSDKVYFVIEGSGTISVGDDERPVEPGAVVFAPAGEPHGVSNPGPDRLRVLVFMAPPP
jgi:mannose-6-phosphate isomerase-like protein (cupin superfamily)